MAKHQVQVSDNIFFAGDSEAPMGHLKQVKVATAFAPAEYEVVATNRDLTDEAVDKLEGIKAGNREDVIQQAKGILTNPNSYTELSNL